MLSFKIPEKTSSHHSVGLRFWQALAHRNICLLSGPFVKRKRPATPCRKLQWFLKKRGRKESPWVETHGDWVLEYVVKRRKGRFSALLLFLLCLCRATILPLLWSFDEKTLHISEGEKKAAEW
jgi:hypothetical protein